MKTSTSIFAAAAVAASLALAGAALAHPGFGPGMGMGPGGGMGPGMGMGMGMGPGMGMGGGWGMGPGMGMGHGMGPGMMMGGGGADMAAVSAARLAALKTQLKITPAQEGAWKAYEGAVTQQAGKMQALRDKFQAQWQSAKPGETPDFAALRQEMFAARDAAWQAQQKARADLDAVLTPEQQALAHGGWGPRGYGRR